ncbi:MAG: succinylglutamate desuccinylase/aspartoacylase family protein [Clostridia bacterium]|nr:succinylglutamate desuccinylase/aspartoacylase family protein [Clostridia bacterium]
MAVVREITTVAGAALPVYESFSVRRCRYMPEGGADKRVCLASGIHGDELLGQLVLCETAQRIMAQPENLLGIVDIYPMLNPLGLDIGERMVPVGTRLDMNRSFPGSPDGTPLERICHQLIEDMRGADLALDIHGGTQQRHALCEARVTARDPEPLIAIARTLNPDLIWVYPDRIAYEASLSGALCRVGTPSLLIQSDERGDVRASASRITNGLFSCLKAMGLWAGEADAPAASIPCIRSEEDVTRITCQRPGMYVPQDCIGRQIRAGQLLGRVIDALEGGVVEEITAPCAGLVFTQRSYTPVYPGTMIARIYARRNEA